MTTQIKRRWLLVTAVYTAIILIFYFILQSVWPDYTNRWSAVTAVTVAYCLWIVWQHLPEPFPSGSR
ncbi:MAG: hypothetical protein GY796_25820 [Chloroflexi bacterium]|nr:hypothetical protein [Chloroflexota bacterium]